MRTRLNIALCGVLALALAFLSHPWALADEEGAKSLFFRQLQSPGQVMNLGLTYSIELVRKGTILKVDSRYPFENGDQIRFHVRPNVDGYMYILLTSNNGDQLTLFPDRVAQQDNKVIHGKEYVLPQDGVFVFDEKPGLETIQLLLSRLPLDKNSTSSERSITIKPKGSADIVAQKCYLEASDNGASNASAVQSSGIASQASFLNDPSMTVVTTDTSRPFLVDVMLKHESKNSEAPTLVASSSGHGKSQIRAVCPTPPPGNAGGLGQSGGTDNSPIEDKWALVIGISHFMDQRLNLMYPAKDARDFAQFLIKEEHFAPDHVKVLVDGQATRQGILTQLGTSWLPKNVKPGDLVLLFVASHGSAAEMDVARKNFLVAYDTDPRNLFVTGIEMQDLTRMIKRRLNSDRILVVLDTCHAGAAEPGAKSLPAIAGFNIEDVVQGTGQLVIASSCANQTSHDSKRYANGIFTKHLIDGLRQYPDLENAFKYTRAAVASEAAKDFGHVQTPVLKESEWKGAGLKLGVPPFKPRTSEQY